jgi:hypothetical protein
MADQNPTAGPRVVPVDLSVEQTQILRDGMLGWLAGIEEDLAWSPETLCDPEATVREADAFRRLLVSLDVHEIALPDEDARSALAGAAHGYDEASDYERIAAVHDAHHSLLAILDVREVGR